jgi:hypothetical protein
MARLVIATSHSGTALARMPPTTKAANNAQITHQTRSRSPRAWRHSRRTRRGASPTQPRRGLATTRWRRTTTWSSARPSSRPGTAPPVCSFAGRWHATCDSGTSACEHVPRPSRKESRMDARGEPQPLRTGSPERGRHAGPTHSPTAVWTAGRDMLMPIGVDHIRVDARLSAAPGASAATEPQRMQASTTPRRHGPSNFGRKCRKPRPETGPRTGPGGNRQSGAPNEMCTRSFGSMQQCGWFRRG